MRPSELIENPTTIAEHLRKRQIELGISQANMAKLLEVSETSVTSWYHGRNVPVISQYPRIIEFIGYNPLFTDETTIGGQIRKYRIEKGLSYRNFANITGYDPATLARWEKNTSVPYSKDKKKLVAMGILK